MQLLRERIKNAKRIVIKVGSSSLTYPETGKLDLAKMEVLVRQLSSLRNAGNVPLQSQEFAPVQGAARYGRTS